MAKFTDLSSIQLNKTLARRFIPLADKLRDMMTKFGLRPYKVRMVRVQWSNGIRGEGTPMVIQETVLLPTPLIQDFSGLTEIVQPVGLDEVGGVQLAEVSGRFTEEDLTGKEADGSPIPDDQEFFYEVEFPRPDGKAGVRRRFYPRGPPTYFAGRLQWTVSLERSHEERDRMGAAE